MLLQYWQASAHEDCDGLERHHCSALVQFVRYLDGDDTEDCGDVGRSAEEGDWNRVSHAIEDDLKEVGEGVDADARFQERERTVSG